MMRLAQSLFRNAEGAVAPTVALSLLGLIAVGGIAFDYARMASMDTELQNAADQAALAAATQLDGEAGSRARAISAAQTLVANLTYFANDGDSDAITVPTIIFYSDYDPVTGAKGPVAGSDADANYVLVTVGARTANYALTPIVAALSSGAMTASAFATLDSAYCNLPPFLLCQPSPNFNVADNIGKGLRLVIGSTVAPGNFGFIQTGFGTGAENLAKALGWQGAAGGCVRARGGIPTEPGNKQSVRAAFNTRFDLSESGQTCPAGGSCPPSTNSRKDLVHGNNCGTGGQQGWREPEWPYRARNADPLSAANPMIADDPATPGVNETRTYPETMGHPRDLCHAVSQAGVCPGNGIVGTGVWDRDAYFWINYNWNNATWKTRTGLTDDPAAANYATRYKVYLWEAANPLPDGAAGTIGIGKNQPVQVVQGSGFATRYTSSWTGNSPAPERTCRDPGVPPPADPLTDRRATSVAVVDCTGLNGRDVVPPLEWMDVFLVEPTYSRGTGSGARTDNGDIYVEVIGPRPLPGVNENLGQVIRRDVPRLIE